MRKIRKFVVIATILFVSAAMFTSCIKEEALNAEADIEKATFEGASDLLLVEPVISNTKVIFKLMKQADSEMFKPSFILTKGATISPESGTELDFTEPKEYIVTSEDGRYTKKYTVEFVVDEGILFDYSFDNVNVIETDNPNGIYHEFYELLPGKDFARTDWDSGNFGFNILAETLLPNGEELTPAFYPTAQTEEGYKGKAVVMHTKSTGFMGTMMQSPLAAGNLYLGSFNFTMPAIKSTHFGQPYTSKYAPKALSGYFKYKAGDKFKVNNKPSYLESDMWDAYAILFDTVEDNNYLTGDHNFEDSRMISVARLGKEFMVETDEWTKFEIPFEYINGKSFDPEKGHMFTIVFSSSKEGARYNGAVGSTLYIDEVHISTDGEDVEE